MREQNETTSRRTRWALRGGSVAIIMGGGMLIASFALSPVWFILGVVFFGIGVLWWAVLGIDRIVRAKFGLPSRHERTAPSTDTDYRCPRCEYDLRGTTGVFCPECGTVRPARVDGEQSPVD